MMVIEDLLGLVIKRKASDLHLAVNYPPIIRVDGVLSNLGAVVLSDDVIEGLLFSLLDEKQTSTLKGQKELDLSHTHASGDRFRINMFYEKGHLSAAFRLIPSAIKTIEELGLPPICHEFAKLSQGLILVTGPTGQGKTTTLAAIIQEINELYSKNIVTVEDPIEYLFPKAKSLVRQREIEHDTLSWDGALRSALREDPNVVLIGEVRDYETVSSAVTIAETGHLVFSTLHTNSASQTIDRMIDVFPENQQNQVRSQLASILEGVISQRLIEGIGGGRVIATEVLLATPAVRNVIREGKTYQIDNIIQTSGDLGMMTLEKSLVRLVREGKITLDAAQAVSLRPDEIIRLFK